MKTIPPWKLWIFVASLFAIALLVNGAVDEVEGRSIAARRAQYLQEVQDRQNAEATRQAVETAKAVEQKKLDEARKVEEVAKKAEEDRKEAAARKAEEEQKAAEEAAAAHARFLARYVNTAGEPPKPTIQKVAIVAATEAHKVDFALESALTKRFKSEPVTFFPYILRPEFVSDGVFEKVFTGSPQILRQLELSNSLDMVVLAKESVEFHPNPSLDNVLTANLRLDIETIPVESAAETQSWTFSATGAGFKEADARALAEERLLQQIAADTNMSLIH